MGLLVGALAVRAPGYPAGLGGVVALMGAGLVVPQAGCSLLATGVPRSSPAPGHKRLMPQAVTRPGWRPGGRLALLSPGRWSPSLRWCAWLLLLLPEPGLAGAAGRDVRPSRRCAACTGPWKYSVAIDWTRLDAEMMAERQASCLPLSCECPRCVPPCSPARSHHRPGGARSGGLVWLPLIATELGDAHP